MIIESETDLKYFDPSFTYENIEYSSDSMDKNKCNESGRSRNKYYKGFTYITNSIANEMMNFEGNFIGSTE